MEISDDGKLTFKLPTFEGPLDLLLHLIKKNEMDIYDIPMSKITSQYIDYLHQMQSLELDIAGEYLVIAAMLVNIKSKMLLPSTNAETMIDDEDVIDPREELVAQLVLHQTFQEAAGNLRLLSDERMKQYTREMEDPPKESLKDHLEPNGGNLKALGKAFAKLMMKRKLKEPVKRKINLEKYRLKDEIEILEKKIRENKEPIIFEDLFPKNAEVELVVTIFMAMLELMKRHELKVLQERNFGSIILTGGDASAVDQAKIESLLFVSGSEGISLTEISQLIGLLKPAVHDQILRLNKKYQEDSSCSFEIIEAGERYRLATKKVFSNLLKQYFEAPSMIEISGACLETLSIIAYKQPVTRIEIEEIRGVQSGGMIQKLLLLDLIKEDGRLDAPGRPILYSTTTNFLDYFGIKTLSELPELPKDKDEQASDEDVLELFNEKLYEEEQ